MVVIGLALLWAAMVPLATCHPLQDQDPSLPLNAVVNSASISTGAAGAAAETATRIRRRLPTPVAKPIVNITAIFETEDLDDFGPVFEMTLARLKNRSDVFKWAGVFLTASRDMNEMVTRLCNHFQGDRSHIRLLVVFGKVSTVHMVNIVSHTIGIPVIGYMLDKGDKYVQIHNPFYLSLQPSQQHLARGMASMLYVNFWFRLTMFIEEGLRYDGFHRTFRELTRDGKWSVENEIFIPYDISDSELSSCIDSLNGNTSKIFILHSSSTLARRIFKTASRVLSPDNRFAWIITKNAYTQNENILVDYPLGLKAFLVNDDVKTKHLLRDALDLIFEAFHGDGSGNSELLHRLLGSSSSSSSSSTVLPASSSTLSSSSSTSPSSLSTSSQFTSTHNLASALSSSTIPFFSSFSQKDKSKGCWSATSMSSYPHKDPVYSSLLSTSVYGLNGELAFDDEGFMNITKYRVRNLVNDGRKSVWQDIGCVSGKEIRPFRIVWPGDAKDIKAKTEGKKIYRVVTNPVQPFVITEAPHKDYASCLSDTPCLNLTNKFKSKEVVWKAIEAYENGEGEASQLFQIQCCRGLTIDLLNKLASDLEFSFTLYIVQDETYGQIENDTWSGMMKDLRDNTAHFAIGAFSITSQREIAIDFTGPYFFSGFSIIYSDRTRETSMLAFLEPFSTRVWFAIILTAFITAIFMALFEWNSPFGLNPWGRKRDRNYSLASGLTMVFSVVFGHTVKTKSPKSWPSKLLQNLWSFAAIFIIASYTANLAAFIAGKHAGINYVDIQDYRLQSIRVGVLPGSAVDEILKKMGSQLVSVSHNYKVPKTDVGIDWVVKGKLDALLGDYPILDYARAHLAPSCELKLISKVFGDDQYGIGIPKFSPLKAALSKKISEYHRVGYIDDLIDVHFADAHCIKKRISEEDSQLEVTHHAGLFVMLCVGFGVGVIVLVLEYLIYKFLVPYIRQCPETSRWKSVHLMFLSQRLQRIIYCAELVSPHQSAKEMLGIVKKRDFARLFQKSTIRRNRLADIAKTKRINRNFYDIVEKAKWLKEMKDSGLMDDDDQPETPNIIEIPLRKLTVNVEMGSSALKVDTIECSPRSKRRRLSREVSPGICTDEECLKATSKSESESTSAESDDSLLGRSRQASQISLPSPDLPLTPTLVSPISESRHRRRRFRKQRYHTADITSSPEMDGSSPCSTPDRRRSLSLVHTSCNSSPIRDLPPNNKPPRARASLACTTVVNEVRPGRRSSSYRDRLTSPTPSAVSQELIPVAVGSLLNGISIDSNSDESACESTPCITSRDRDEDIILASSSTLLTDNSTLLNTLSNDANDITSASASNNNINNNSNKALVPKSSNIDIARSLLYKARSYQDHLSLATECAQAWVSSAPFCLENVTKEELLLLWKTSEMDLNKRLDAALLEKAKLERRLALLQKHHSPV